mmetsp:Transcript_9481/g.13941  ORF Transcript_9481/g.13941 Transcript_9481/m.13941 type:complete len:144 (-) Transcript_9481:164-595(-)
MDRRSLVDSTQSKAFVDSSDIMDMNARVHAVSCFLQMKYVMQLLLLNDLFLSTRMQMVMVAIILLINPLQFIQWCHCHHTRDNSEGADEANGVDRLTVASRFQRGVWVVWGDGKVSSDTCCGIDVIQCPLDCAACFHHHLCCA